MRHENWVKMDKRKFPRLALLFNDALSCLTFFSSRGNGQAVGNVPIYAHKSFGKPNTEKRTKGQDFHPFRIVFCLAQGVTRPFSKDFLMMLLYRQF